MSQDTLRYLKICKMPLPEKNKLKLAPAKKLAPIEKHNPKWNDLYEDIV